MSGEVKQLGVETKSERRKALCIDLLERMLAEAKEGHGFDSVLFLATYPDSGNIRNAWTEGDSTLDLVGRLERLKFGLLYAMERRETPG